MHEVKAKVEEICKLKDSLIDITKAHFTQGLEGVDTAEAGAVIDMIKDLADAEKNCWKAAYYKSIVCAMEEAEESGESPWMDRAGYDHWRYSNGHYAPKGHGHYTKRVGYVPPMNWPTYSDPWMDPTSDFGRNMMNERLGYVMDPNYVKMGETQKMGATHYDKYKDARRHYTESHSKQDREMMDSHASGHMMETIETVKDIWRDATPELKKKMKSDLSSLMSEMTI